MTNEYIYIAGGILQGKMTAVSTCEVYDIAYDKWIQLAPLPVPTFSLSLGMFNSTHLLAVGGTDNFKAHLATIW